MDKVEGGSLMWGEETVRMWSFGKWSLYHSKTWYGEQLGDRCVNWIGTR